MLMATSSKAAMCVDAYEQLAAEDIGAHEHTVLGARGSAGASLQRLGAAA
jgi:hypothetical protein